MYFNIVQPLVLKSDEASPSIILAGRALLVKMLITLELCYAFGSNFEYLFLFFFLLFCFFFFNYFFHFFILFYILFFVAFLLFTFFLILM